MTPVALDAELAAKLTANGGKVPLTDPAGKLIGYFLTPAEYEFGRRAVLAKVLERVTDAKTREALADPDQYGVEDLLNVLRGLGG